MRGLFVTGTDTEVGKTALSAAICAALVAEGLSVAAHKPVLSGLDEGGAGDHEVLASVTGQRAEDVAPLRFGPAVSPHLAAELAGVAVDGFEMVARARSAGEGGDALVVEGVGGLLVPVAPGFSVRDFAVALGLPVVVAARPGLGTINHTLLTLEAARGSGLDVRAIVLTPWPGEPTAMQRSNRETIEALGEVEVATLPLLPDRTPETYASAGAPLRPQRWLG